MVLGYCTEKPRNSCSLNAQINLAPIRALNIQNETNNNTELAVKLVFTIHIIKMQEETP